MDTSNNKLFGVTKDGKEAKIQMFIVVEIFRLAAFLWFLIQIKVQFLQLASIEFMLNTQKLY